MIEELIFSDFHYTQRNISEYDILVLKKSFDRMCSHISDASSINLKPLIVSTMNRDVHVVRTSTCSFVVIDENLAWLLDDLNRILIQSTDPEDSIAFLHRMFGERFRIAGLPILAATCAVHYMHWEKKKCSYLQDNKNSKVEYYRSVFTQLQINFIICHEIFHEVIENRRICSDDLTTIKAIIHSEIIPKHHNVDENEQDREALLNHYLKSSGRDLNDDQIKKWNDDLTIKGNILSKRRRKRWETLANKKSFLLECLCDIEATIVIIKDFSKGDMDRSALAMQACLGAIRHLSIIASCNWSAHVYALIWDAEISQREINKEHFASPEDPNYQDKLNLRHQVLAVFLMKEVEKINLKCLFEFKDNLLIQQDRHLIYLALNLEQYDRFFFGKILPHALKDYGDNMANEGYYEQMARIADIFLTDEILT